MTSQSIETNLPRLLLAAPMLVAATAPDQGLDTPALLYITTAMVGVILLRGVFMRRHLRRKRRERRTRDEQE